VKPLEVITILLTAGSLLSLLFYRRKGPFLYLLFLTAIVTIVQYLVGGLRWQMLVALYILPAMFITYKFKIENSFTGTVLGIWFLISASIPWAVPVFTMPAPNGDFSIGSETFHWVDSSRLEWFTDENDKDVREIVVQAWYPSDDSNSIDPNQYMDFMKLRSKTLASAGKIPAFLPSHLDMIMTNTRKEVDCSERLEKYPVFIFSHGITGSRHLHQVLFEHLASRGYVVFAPDHSFDANLTIFPDGKIADYRSEITGHPDSILIREKQINTRAFDIGFIIDQIRKIETGIIDSKLSGKLDLNKVALGGHSYGGATAILASHNHEIIKACVVLDGWISPIPDKVISEGINVPFLFMGRPSWDDSDYPGNYERLADLIADSSNEQYDLRINHTLHLDYTDIPLMSPLVKHVMDVGELSPSTTLSLINDLVLGFLEVHLLERDHNGFRKALHNNLLIKS
jgi:pimeloyl-ACP methyl ester carboxylesterase